MVVLAAVNRDEDTDKIVKQGQKIAEAFGEPLQVVHVLSRAELRDLERVAYDETGQAVEMERVKEIAETIAHESTEEVADEADSIGLVGDPAKQILAHARDQDATYIVIGGRKTSPVGKAIFGSVTQSILLNADRPVVTVMED